ncbi:MAG TPA: SDR family oxidoreductase [Thermoanaerobaculia bacterium]|nr:SDR family oxidoreductase [Thermoanaerobaculia bacterium]
MLVTGHHGYLGSVAAPLLASAGHDVVGLDSDLFEGCTLGPRPPEGAWRSLRRDLREIELADLAGIDAVVHFAALSNDPLGDLDPELTYEINLRGSIRLAEMARDAGVRRFLFSSSCSNYGASGDRLLDESAELQPLTAYAISKVRFEEELGRMASDRFTPVLLRNATAYGVSPRLRVDLVLNNLVAWGVTTGQIVLQSDGTPWRPIVHAEDIARAFLRLLDAPRESVHAKAFNIVPEGENYQIRDLAEIVAEAVPGCAVTFAEGAGPDPRNYRVSGTRLLDAFPDFSYRWNARRGAHELVAAYRAAGLDRQTFEGPRFKRLAWIRRLLAEGLLSEDLRWTGAARPVATA